MTLSKEVVWNIHNIRMGNEWLQSKIIKLKLCMDDTNFNYIFNSIILHWSANQWHDFN